MLPSSAITRGLSSPANRRNELKGLLGAEGSFKLLGASLLVLRDGGGADIAAPADRLETAGEVSEGVELGGDDADLEDDITGTGGWREQDKVAADIVVDEQMNRDLNLTNGLEDQFRIFLILNIFN